MIWDICIRRPVFTTMLVLGPVVLGLASYTRLGVELFPNVDVPVVVVTTTLKGASVEEMESSVTKPVEEAVNTVSGIDELRIAPPSEGVSTGRHRVQARKERRHRGPGRARQDVD